MLPLVLALCVICVVCSGVSFVLDRLKVGVGGPFPLPVVGNGLLFLGDNANYIVVLKRLKEKYGCIFLGYVLSIRFLLTSNAAFTEAVLSNIDYIDKSYSYSYLTPWLGQGLLTSTGHTWKSHRKLITPAFHFNILQKFLPVFLKNQKILEKKLQSVADGRPLDVFPVMALVALDNIAESAMGVSVHAQEHIESEYVKAIKVVSSIVSARMFNPILGLDATFNLLPQKRAQDKAIAFLHQHTRQVISDRQKLLQQTKVTLDDYSDSQLGIKRKCAFLDLLLLSQNDGEKMDLESIRQEVDTFMFEGHDTTTSALCFTLYCIAKNKGVDDKILEEQRSIFGDDFDREPTYGDLQHMKYLELVIKESLRLYPSVPYIARTPSKETEIHGVFIPKDTNVTFDILNMQRDPELFENPLEFIPERFATSAHDSTFKYIPFSAGPRNCIGQKFAMLELKVVISNIVKKFVIESANEPVLCYQLILKSKTGVHLSFLPRQQKVA